MARNKGNLLAKFHSGKVGKDIVFKRHGDSTVMAKYNDRSDVLLSILQVKQNDLFAEAVAYAKTFLENKQACTELEKKLKANPKTRHRSVYNVVLQKFLKERSTAIAAAERRLDDYQQRFPVSDRQLSALQYLVHDMPLSNKAYRELHRISKATATRDLQLLVDWGLIMFTGRGAGLTYSLVQSGGNGTGE
ncbi:hypothetical protein [Flavihumibacter petaseus]|uniref:HTH deoR-type domain-containing protein n=1 Tax=Flavihumibacter petaseus NBRC 106054 TaxID=1220578 RepID=A0A0E9MUD8_9BACT|nr:hypothetical protein [Flavihumibacter petaseus]GAO41098.1 hypothetical protein FPE01S_01_01100 [Flavihumibacter petaseus NBRC 106054]